MSTIQQEAANDHVNVSVTRDAGCRVVFDMQVPAKETQAAYAKAIKSVNKEVSIPGFRKGKAPDKLVLQHYSQYVEREWRNLVMDKAFQEAVNLTKIYPLHQSSIQSPDVKALSHEGAHVIIRFESMPQVPDIDITQLSLTPQAKEPVSEEQKEKALHDLRLFHAEWTPVNDRPVQQGDFVELDIDAIESPSYNICTNEHFEVDPKRMPSWLMKLVLGLSVGQHVEGTSEYDSRFPQAVAESEFKPTNIRITVKSIQLPKLPPVDDHLAQKAGVETAETLRERIVQSLEHEAQAKVERDLQRQVVEQLLQKFPCDLPKTLLDEERQTRTRNRIRGLQKVLSENQIREKSAEISEQAAGDAIVFIHLYYLLRPWANQHQIEVTQADLYQELTRQLHQLPVEEQVIEQDMEPDGVRSKLVAMVTINKAIAHIVSQLEPGSSSK